jgi:hypothetical protein
MRGGLCRFLSIKKPENEKARVFSGGDHGADAFYSIH